jgi:hypothetical protein
MVLLTFSLLLVLFLSSRALLSGVLFWAMGRGSFFCMLLLGFLLLVPSSCSFFLFLLVSLGGFLFVCFALFFYLGRQRAFVWSGVLEYTKIYDWALKVMEPRMISQINSNCPWRGMEVAVFSLVGCGG